MNPVVDKTNLVKTLTTVLYTLNWVGLESPFTQDLSVIGVNSSNSGLVGLGVGATITQYESAANAMLLVTKQDIDKITITAFGAKPEIDIPISILIMG